MNSSLLNPSAKNGSAAFDGPPVAPTPAVSPDNFSFLTPKQIINASVSKLLAWRYDQNGALPLQIALASMTRAQIAKLKAPQLVALGPYMNLLETRFDAISSKTIAKLPSDQLAFIHSRYVQFLHLDKLSAASIAAAGGNFVNGVITAQLSMQKAKKLLLAFPIADFGQLTLVFLAGFSRTNRAAILNGINQRIAALTLMQFASASFDPQLCALLSPIIVSQMNLATLAAASRLQTQALRLSALTGTALATLGLTFINNLSTPQLAALSLEQLTNLWRNLTPLNFAQLLPDFFKGVRPEVLLDAWLALHVVALPLPGNFDTLSVALTADQANAFWGRFTTTTVNAFSAGYKNSLSYFIHFCWPSAYFALLAPDTVAALSPFLLKQLPRASARSLNIASMTAPTLISLGLDFVNQLGGTQLEAMRVDTVRALIQQWGIDQIAADVFAGLLPATFVSAIVDPTAGVSAVALETIRRMPTALITALPFLTLYQLLNRDTAITNLMLNAGTPGHWSIAQLNALLSNANAVQLIEPALLSTYLNPQALLGARSLPFTAAQWQQILNTPTLATIVYGAGTGTGFLTAAQMKTLAGSTLAGMTQKQLANFTLGLQVFTDSQIAEISKNPALLTMRMDGEIGSGSKIIGTGIAPLPVLMNAHLSSTDMIELPTLYQPTNATSIPSTTTGVDPLLQAIASMTSAATPADSSIIGKSPIFMLAPALVINSPH